MFFRDFYNRTFSAAPHSCPADGWQKTKDSIFKFFFEPSEEKPEKVAAAHVSDFQQLFKNPVGEHPDEGLTNLGGPGSVGL